MSNLRVTVLGAGVVGLSTACAAQRAFPNAELSLVAADYESATTSHVAAGYFCPTADKSPTGNSAVLTKWVAASGEHYRQLATSADSEMAGVGVAAFYELSNQADAEVPLFAPHVFSCRRLTDEELDRILPAARSVGVASCYQAVTAYAQGDRYLPYLLNTLRRGGRVSVHRARLDSLAEATSTSGGCDLLFNCSGLGAGRLCQDPEVYPTRGQVVRVDAPMQKFALHGPGVQYVLPNRSDVVLGGTSAPGSSNTSVSEADTADILARVCRLLPALRRARVLGAHVGLRPTRRGGTRLELEGPASGAGCPVVHNYGHGANGVGLSWGSAVHAVELATEALRGGGVGGGRSKL